MLEPVSTTGLTSEDVPELITRVRDSMLAALLAMDSGVSSSVKAEASETTPLLSTTHVTTPGAVPSGDVEGSDEEGVLVDRP